MAGWSPLLSHKEGTADRLVFAGSAILQRHMERFCSSFTRRIFVRCDESVLEQQVGELGEVSYVQATPNP